MTTETKLSPPSLYVVMVSSIFHSVNQRGLFTEIGRHLKWQDGEIEAAIKHAKTHVHTKLFLAPKDLAETRASVLAVRLQSWVAKTTPLPPSITAFNIGVHKND